MYAGTLNMYANLYAGTETDTLSLSFYEAIAMQFLFRGLSPILWKEVEIGGSGVVLR